MEHLPVLLRECIDFLNIDPEGIYVDGTLGRGGHAFEIAGRLSSGRLIAIDRDSCAIDISSGKLSAFGDKISFVHGNFCDLSGILDTVGAGLVDGMLFDFGVSSPQLDNGERGFSYMKDAPLDMRMDMLEGLTAYDIVNSWPEDKLRDLLFEYGEERYAKLIAREIVKRRAVAPIETTFGLNGAIVAAMPAAARREAQHPSKRSFQALRIAVNDELGSIRRMLDSAPERLKKGGRICVISFHSLEDRIVKGSFATCAADCVCPKGLPVCVCGTVPSLKLITKKPVVPGDDEIERNPRARSAKLRVAERI